MQLAWSCNFAIGFSAGKIFCEELTKAVGVESICIFNKITEQTIQSSRQKKTRKPTKDPKKQKRQSAVTKAQKHKINNKKSKKLVMVIHSKSSDRNKWLDK